MSRWVEMDGIAVKMGSADVKLRHMRSRSTETKKAPE